MKKFLLTNLSTLLLCLSITACAQNKNKDSKNNKSENNNLTTKKAQQIMDLSKITNSKVHAAMTAWQNGDSKTFLSYFTPNPTMTDDGSPRSFLGFVKEACGEEKFLTIDSVDNDAKEIIGNFKAGKWGTFRVFFKFHQNADGQFDRLDIGQSH